MKQQSRAFLLAAAGSLAVVSGCSTRHDPHYNPYASPGGGPALLERAEAAVNSVDEAVENLDERLENFVY
ncbi:MAG: hypothetical protein KKB50_08010 [Planctomycetes bacterium]|nr:hypothetical protein [Planctomycetota bacterium]